MRPWLITVAIAATAAAQEVAPVLIYDLGGQPAGLLRDRSGHGAHAIVPADLPSVDCPTGQAALFDGSRCLTARETTQLVLRQQLTLDVWLRYDAIESQGCVLDKQGEAYRIAVLPGGKFYFGLKGEGSRADLNAEGLQPGRWQRITATFDRPKMTVYLDGVQVGQMTWDHAIDPGGPLHLGAKSRLYDRFRGAIDQLHIYNLARPPQPGDETRYGNKGADAMPAQLTVTQTADRIRVDTGAIEAQFDPASGGLLALRAAGHDLVRDNHTPPLTATLLASRSYDGTRDLSPEALIEARWTGAPLTVTQTQDAATLTGKGTLQFPDADRIEVVLTYSLQAGQRRVRVAVQAEPKGEFRGRFLRCLGVQQPLCLEPRQRVILPGDQGVREDIRCQYQFHTHVQLLDEPDRNCWRHFLIDQDTDHSYAMWRSESWETAGLTGFRGRQAPGWIGVYDREGGALFAYQGLSARAPKSLAIDTEAGATGVTWLLAPTHAALHPSAPEARRTVFGAPHTLDWVFFAGEAAFEQPERDLASAWGQAADPSAGLPAFQPLDDTLKLWTSGPAPADLSPIVEGGIPLPRGAITRPDQVRLFVGDAETPLEAKPLAFWPDQSLKWLLLIFPLQPHPILRAEAGRGDGDEIRFRVTLRQGDDVPCRLVFGPTVSLGRLLTPMTVSERAGGVDLDTGPLQVQIATGTEWLRRVRLRGRDVLRADGQPQAFVDFLRPDASGYRTGATHPTGSADPGPVTVTALTVEERGLRTVVRLEAMAQSREPARVILRLEAWAGTPFLKITHTVEFLHADPRTAFLRRLGLRLPLALQPGSLSGLVGGQDGPVPLAPATQVGLTQTDHDSYRAWRAQAGQPWFETVESKARCRGWLDLRAADAGVCVVQRNLWQEAPKELRYDAADRALTVAYWPDSVPLMDLRRYSLYPHQAQGETVSANQRWVLDDYYANDPVKGISKTHETFLVFHSPELAPTDVDAVAADIQSRPLLYVGWDGYAQTGITMPLAPVADAAFAKTNAATQDLADWWLFHQRAWGWYGMWDYGDVQHHYRDGYGRIFPPDVLGRILALPPKQRNEVKPGGDYPAVMDYFTQNDWAYDNGRWGWSNTEGLVNHFMSQMYLRSGRRDLFFFIEANARHARDVDARHAGKWFGRGTRHGVQHWSDGDHEERQTTFTEQRFHYLLTGEARTREWNRDLADNWYLKTPCSVHADHSGRSYGLLFRWEITGDPELGRVMKDYMRALATPEGIAISTPVAFPEAKASGPPRGLNDGNMFFHSFGAMHALLEYWYLTRDEQVGTSIIRTADDAVKRGPAAAGDLLRKTVAFAARQAPDPTPYRQALREWCAGGTGSRYAFQQVTHNRDHWTGETSFLYGNVSGGLFWANDALYVLGALAPEPEPSPDTLRAMAEREQQPRLPRSPLPRGSWQDEYDRPEFKDYLRDRLSPAPAKP